MKKFSLVFFSIVSLILTNAVAQESIQFSFIGKVGGKHESILITSATNWRKSDTEMVLIDRRAFDTLKFCILHNQVGSKRSGNPQINTSPDSLESNADIKVTGLGSEPWYFRKTAYSELVRSCTRHFETAGLMTPRIRDAFLHLRFLGNEDFYHRHEQDPLFIDTSTKYTAIRNDHAARVISDAKNHVNYILDTSHIYVEARNQSGERIWRTDPWKDSKWSYTLYDRPIVIEFQFKNDSFTHFRDVLAINYDNLGGAVIDAKTGKLISIGQD